MNKRQAFACSKWKIDCSSFCAISTAPQLAKKPPAKTTKTHSMSKSTTCLLFLWCLPASRINVSENTLAQNLTCLRRTFYFHSSLFWWSNQRPRPGLPWPHVTCPKLQLAAFAVQPSGAEAFLGCPSISPGRFLIFPDRQTPCKCWLCLLILLHWGLYDNNLFIVW